MIALIGLLGVAALVAGLGVYVWRAAARNPVNRWFAAYTLSMAAWTSGIAALNSASHLDAWGRFTFASASLIPAFFLAFTRAYPSEGRWPPRLLIRGTLTIGVALALLSLTTPLVVHSVTRSPSGIGRESGPLYPFFSIYFLSAWVTALAVFLTKWWRERGQARAHLQYLGAGLIVSGIGGITTNLVVPLVTGRSGYSWLGPFFILPMVALVGHAIIRHRLMDLRLVIHRGLAHTLVIFVVAAIAIVPLHFLVSRMSADGLSARAAILLASFVALILLSAPGQRAINTLLDPYLFRGRLDHASALTSATRTLSRFMQPSQLARELRQIFEKAFVPESYSMIVRESEGHRLEPVFADPLVANLLAAAPTVAHVLESQRAPYVFLVDPASETSVRKTVHEGLRAAGVELVVSLGRRGAVLGSILLGPRRSGDAYFRSDINFIESVAEVASIALENALLYRQRIQILEYSDRLLESLDSAVVAVDANGVITSSNPAAAALLGLASPGRPSTLTSLPEEVAWALALAVTGAWQPRDIEIAIDHRARGVVPAILSTAVLHDQQRRVIGALAITTDLSTVKALERNQRRVEHLAMMARFYAGVAHEIRNPLASISNIISMLPDHFHDAEYRETASRLVPMEIARIVRLADRLRLMAPSEGGKLAPVSLSSLLNDIVAIHAPAALERKIKIELHCADDLPTISADPGQLMQMFLNLIKNASEAMSQGGTLTLEAVSVGDHDGGRRVIARVIDEGVGIDAAIRAKIFQPFFTTKPTGTGLGLSICREIADFHRARLSLLPRSKGTGTVAQIEFPAAHHSIPDEPVGVSNNRSEPVRDCAKGRP